MTAELNLLIGLDGNGLGRDLDGSNDTGDVAGLGAREGVAEP